MRDRENTEKYPSLQTIAGHLKIVAWGTLILGGVVVVIVVLLGLSMPGDFRLFGIVCGILVFLCSITSFILTRACGEIILVFIDIEKNTRMIIGDNCNRKKDELKLEAVDSPNATWDCPECKNSNSSYSFKCCSCGYSLI